MRTSIVPAQITTVEDRVAGSLSLSQMLLLAAPIFVGSAMYAALPPNFGGALYKTVVIAAIFVACSLLAIRFRGKILLLWAIILLNYNLRARYHVYNKNDAFLRDTLNPPAKKQAVKSKTKSKADAETPPKLSMQELVRLQNILDNPDAKLHFLTDKKGAMSVRITEVK